MSGDCDSVYIKCPFHQKDEAKSLGAQWDPVKRSWYVPPGTDPSPLLARWQLNHIPAPAALPMSPQASQSRSVSEAPFTPERGVHGQGSGRTYIDVPYAEKDQAKMMGAWFDFEGFKKWFIPPGVEAAPLLARWRQWQPPQGSPQRHGLMSSPAASRSEVSAGCSSPGVVSEQPSQSQDDKTYLHVPFHEKDEAKALGAQFDWDQKQWYVPAGVSSDPFGKWTQWRNPHGLTGALGAWVDEYVTENLNKRPPSTRGICWDWLDSGVCYGGCSFLHQYPQDWSEARIASHRRLTQETHAAWAWESENICHCCRDRDASECECEFCSDCDGCHICESAEGGDCCTCLECVSCGDKVREDVAVGGAAGGHYCDKPECREEMARRAAPERQEACNNDDETTKADGAEGPSHQENDADLSGHAHQGGRRARSPDGDGDESTRRTRQCCTETE